MPNYTQNQTIIQSGEPFVCFFVITEGSVSAVYDSSENSKPFILKKGDIIGIFDFGFKEHSFTYKALEDVQLTSYPLTDFSHLPALLKEHNELSHFLVLSMVQNVSRVISYYHSLTHQQEKLYLYLNTASSNYQKLCQHYSLPVKTLSNKERLQPFSLQQEEPPFWIEDYYNALKTPVLEQNSLFRNPALMMGLLARSASEIHHIMYCCQDLQEYLQELSQLLLNDNSLDLFDLYTDLLFRAKNAKKDVLLLQDRIFKMITVISNQNCIDKQLAISRIEEYKNNLKRDHSYDMATEESMEQIKQKLANSMELILDYADIMSVTRNEFIEYIELYKNLADKNSLDKNVDTIRRTLTKLFHTIYIETFQIALHDPTPPTVVKMFLNFGYVDLELAGLDNAAYLYSVSKNYQGDPKNGIYTMYEWITAIFNGAKQPSRNELSQDYSAHVHALRSQGKIDENTAKRMMEDTNSKVMYELENMFPVANKVTNGRFTTYCPIFIEENVVKNLDSILVTSYKIKEALNKILEVDFSAFYRTYLYVNDKLELRESLLLDQQPDFILLPNLGTAGICWQEIDGMQRSTPGRMLLSALHVENLERTMAQMVGDFRWELCRRIQGMRWNDVTEHSLTSEYYDYIMFYNKNRNLSQDAKEKIKLSLTRARNNYKTMFVMDYTNWILAESQGTVKLNKISRQIFATYCPFRSEICEKLMDNGAFTEILQATNLKKKQQLHRFHKLTQKLLAQGKAVPEELQNHIKLFDM